MFAAGPAQALTTTTATLADFRIGLTDLDPSDGVAPSFVLDPQVRSSVSVGDPSGMVDYLSQQGGSAFGPVSLSAELGGTGGSGSFSGGDPFGAGAAITSSAQGNNQYAEGWSTDFISGPNNSWAVFVLGPQSQVTFSGSGAIDWSASNTGASAYALIDLRLWQVVGDNQEFLGEDDLGSAYYGQGAPSGSVSGPISLTVANDSQASEDVVLDLSLRTYATDREAYPSPVGEPAGAALLLVGVPMLFGLVRRRR
jgi:hypothetical protein